MVLAYFYKIYEFKNLKIYWYVYFVNWKEESLFILENGHGLSFFSQKITPTPQSWLKLYVHKLHVIHSL